MRYTFNMVTMMKEKVNTHFSFPMKLNMAPYAEEYLMQNKDQGTNALLLVDTLLSLTAQSLADFMLILYLISNAPDTCRACSSVLTVICLSHIRFFKEHLSSGSRNNTFAAETERF